MILIWFSFMCLIMYCLGVFYLVDTKTCFNENNRIESFLY